jgi:uncharacterized protein YdaU (DUF1376 family)
MHYYQFHIGDYASHTRHLSLMEDLAFRRLLDFYYLHEKPILQRDIARQIGMRDQEQDVLTVLNEFFISTDDGFVSPRADKEIKDYKEHQAKSAWGAFLRDHKELAPLASKELFIAKFICSEHKKYIETLIEHHAPMMGTSSTNDATTPTPTPTPTPTNHKPIEKKATVVATPDGVSEIVWQDFVKHRKAKKAQVTQTVIDGIQREARKAGWTLESALSEIVLRNWQSFKADWVADKNLSATGQMNQRVASGLTRGLIGGGSNVKLLGN